MSRIAMCLLTVAALGGGGAACGGGGKSLTAEAYAAAGNAVCRAGNDQLAAESKAIQDPKTTGAQFAAFYLDHAIPNARHKLDGLAKLKPPSPERARAKKMVADGRRALDTVEQGLKKSGADYRTPAGAEPFKDFNAGARELKLTDCADKQ